TISDRDWSSDVCSSDLHVVRFRFVPLVLERTLVYGAVLAAVFLFHHLALADVTNRLSEQLRVDFAIVEAVAAAALIVGYQPLRRSEERRVGKGGRARSG